MTPQETLRKVIDPILARPGAGTIELKSGFLAYHANAEDMPRIIGKGGMNVIALKKIMECPGLRLTIIEPGYQVPCRPPARIWQGWEPKHVKESIAAALRWNHREPGVHAYKEGERWKLVFMDTGIPRDLREGIVTWSCAIAMGTGGKIYFEESQHDIREIENTHI